MLDSFTIQKLRDLPIEGVAERLGLEVRRHKSLCPFHDDSRPSLTFNTRKNTYKCYVCEAHGGTIDLVMHHLNKNFAEACKWLADENNIIIEKFKSTKVRVEKEPSVDVRHLSMLVAQPYLCPEAKKFLYEERFISQKVVNQLGLSSISSPVPMSGDLNGSWFNAPSLLIPYRDIDGNLLSVQARYLGSKDSSSKVPRFQFPCGSKCSIFNLPILKTLKAGDPLFVAEGVSDCLALLSAGFPAIAIPSATLLKPEQAKLLKDLVLHIYPDRDAAGERLFLDLKAICPQVIRHQLPEGFKDIGQYYAYLHREDSITHCNHVERNYYKIP